MRLAVFSDIHGNCLALDAVLADLRAQGIEQFVCLGDAIQGGAQPAETALRLRALSCPVVMGNADAWLLTGQETSSHEQVSESQLVTRAWSLAQLSAEDRAWIVSFSPTIEIPLQGGKTLFCFHGSPRSFDDILLPDTSEEEFRGMLDGYDAALLAGGHTHTQQWRRLGDAWYLNPGSVGFAYNWQLPEEQFHADAWADYAIVHTDGERLGVEFRHVPFDVQELIHLTRASGRPYAEQAIAVYRHLRDSG